MSNRINLILVLFLVVAFLAILYVKKIEHFQQNSIALLPPDNNQLNPVSFTYNTDMTNVVKVIDNINVDGRYLNVFECKSITAENGDNYKALGQYMKITDSNLADISDNEKKLVCLNLLVKGGQPPVDYMMIWSSQYLKKPPQQDFSIWRPIPPSGYKSMCDICVPGFSKPSSTNIICLPSSLVENSPLLKDILLNVDYKALNMNYTLHCWNISSHNFFRCANDTESNNNTTPTPTSGIDTNKPLVVDRQFLLDNIFNIKDENLKQMGSKQILETTTTSNGTRMHLSSSTA
jgi:hypothetical protein